MGYTAIKYAPQAYFNYRRSSTEGWSVTNVLLDMTGGGLFLAQMLLQSAARGSLANLRGDVGKLLLCLLTLAFDTLFAVQHYCLYAKSRPAAAAGLRGFSELGDGAPSDDEEEAGGGAEWGGGEGQGGPRGRGEGAEQAQLVGRRRGRS